MTDTPSENENRHEAAPHTDLIRKWEAMTDKQRLKTAEADIFHSILTEGLSKLREVLDALPQRMMRDEVRAALQPFGWTGHWMPYAHLNDDSHEDGIVVEIRASVPEGFNCNTDFDHRGNNFIRAAMVRIATI